MNGNKSAHGTSSTDEVDMWEENVFHLALATASTEFLWWQPSHQTCGIGLPLLETCLDELGVVLGPRRLRKHGTRPVSAAQGQHG